MSDRSEQPRYWFRAKRYGFGWGLPMSREGWAVLIAFAVAALAPVLIWPEAAPTNLLGMVIGTPLFIWACIRKGEPARWRWGSRRP